MDLFYLWSMHELSRAKGQVLFQLNILHMEKPSAKFR